jgi:hypothetical protein
MKTDFVRQEDEEAKENEPRFRNVKKQEDELGRGRQNVTVGYGLLLGKDRQDATARYGLFPGERQTMPRHATENARREVITAVCRAFRSCLMCRCQHDISNYHRAVVQTNTQILYQFLYISGHNCSNDKSVRLYN